MKKFLTALLASCLLLGLCACGGGDDEPAAGPSSPSAAGLAAEPGPAGEAPGALFEVYKNCFDNPNNERGVYRAAGPQGGNFLNILFYNYETMREEYLCATEGCAHDAPGCTSYVAGGGGVNVFAYGDWLYVNLAMRDDGTGMDQNDMPSVIERRNLDGTGGEVMISYPSCELQVSEVFCDGAALYFNAPDGFVRLDLATFEKSIVADIGQNAVDLDDPLQPLAIPLQAYNGEMLYLVLENLPDGRAWASHVMSLNVQTGESRELASWEAGASRPLSFSEDGRGYYVVSATGEIRCYNLSDGSDSLVTEAFCQYNRSQDRFDPDGNFEEIYYSASAWDVQPYGDWLLVNRWNNIGEDGETMDITETHTTAYHIVTGEMKEVPFGNFFNGYIHPMLICGEAPGGLLVTEETPSRMIYSTGTDGTPYNYESIYNIYALITLEDLVNGNPRFNTFQPLPYTGT